MAVMRILIIDWEKTIGGGQRYNIALYEALKLIPQLNVNLYLPSLKSGPIHYKYKTLSFFSLLNMIAKSNLPNVCIFGSSSTAVMVPLFRLLFVKTIVFRHTEIRANNVKDIIWLFSSAFASSIVPVSQLVKSQLECKRFLRYKVTEPIYSWSNNSRTLIDNDAKNRIYDRLQKRIVVVSRCDKMKNLKMLFKLSECLQHVMIDVYGGGLLLQEYQSLANGYKNLHFHGHVEDVFGAIHGSDLLLHLSKFEGGFPLALIDAIDANIPIMCSSELKTVKEILMPNVDYLTFKHSDKPKILVSAISKFFNLQASAREKYALNAARTLYAKRNTSTVLSDLKRLL
jgi:glycosyltransferase involved in cell wall biosynthesis